MAAHRRSDQRRDDICVDALPKCAWDRWLHRLVRRHYPTCRNGLSTAKAASAPSNDKLVVAMPKPRERIQPLMPKLAKRNITPERNNIESSAFCGSDLRVETVYSSGARTTPNVVPSVTGRKATEAATAKKAAHAPARCSRAATSSVP